MIKLSDYVIDFLVSRDIRDIFLVSGGGIMHLLDSVGRNPQMRYYCNYHEQACAASAEGYARVTGKMGVCLVTTGPGAAGALAGAVASWYDSIPILVISGQVRRDLLADYTRVRQIGPQEGNTMGMVREVTKYASSVMEPQGVRRELECALNAATSGRPGPVWIELPLDIQGALIDEAALPAHVPVKRASNDLTAHVRRVIEVLRTARRPMFVAGNGVHLGKAEPLLREVLDRTGIPIVLPHTGKDLVEEDHPAYVGIFGTTGQRRANFAVQNTDCLVSLAAGLNIHKLGFNVAGFAPRATKVVVDIDPGQLHSQVLRPDIAVEAHIRDFLEEFLCQIENAPLKAPKRWTDACARWMQRYPIITPDFYSSPEYVNSYVFMDRLSDATTASDVLVAGNGLDTVSYYQAYRVKRGQRTMTSGWGSMGWDLPLAVGACIGSGRARTICVTGDGSIQWNIQELLTIRHYDLPVKIFIFNNKGYSSIRATQNNFFEGRYVGAEYNSGVDNPDFRHLAAAYRLEYQCIPNTGSLEEGITRTLAYAGATICEVNISPEQVVSPKASAFRRADGTFESRPLEDMAPFLPREEVWENMHLFEGEDR